MDLGTAPPSNAYVAPDKLAAAEHWYPLRVMVCRSCWLVQTEDYIAEAELFDADYAYFSSVAASWLAHAKDYVGLMTQRLGLDAGSTVVEIAANDGYLLQYVRERGIPCYGIEPTKSTAAAARAKGIDIVEEFFGRSLAAKLVAQGRCGDLVAANNVLAHVPDINDFCAGVAMLLKPHGTATFEFPWIVNLVRGHQFDTIYHEHYSYLSLTAVSRIFRENGLAVIDVAELPTHGGSLRVFARRSDSHPVVHASVSALLAQEESAGVMSDAFYSGFQPRIERIKYDLLEFLIAAKREGRKIGAYGAAAKGNTLLNFAGVRADLLPYVADRAAAKQGKFLPGSRIPIVNEQHLLADKPDWVLILPWNLRSEIEGQLEAVRSWGGRFAVAVPQMKTF